LARLIAQPKNPDLQADYTAHLLGLVVADFGIEGTKNITAAAKSSLLKLRPWKTESARLIEAIEGMKEVKDTYTQEVVKQSLAALIPMEAGKTTSGGNNLRDWLSRNPPLGKSVLRSDPASAVQKDAPPAKKGPKKKETGGDG